MLSDSDDLVHPVILSEFEMLLPTASRRSGRVEVLLRVGT
jgi:hypothetical protein